MDRMKQRVGFSPKEYPVFTRTRYYGPDDAYARHDWCRANDCISCGCTQQGPCSSHSPARGYRDRFSDVSVTSTQP